ncbi:putative inactive poly [ADP-ribose] polymerase SRO5 [Sesamum alatum]|uniref:Inactive poly [ADP-ribose] polymerase SRO5 n=1 Tax=Sesamum alatum TaxID=300844 RepID=A0AAE1YBC1_9LAMI|nr:putative inactive poly [ADP-ribose] polymerase SRO5 [Sesamum alatum]
MASIDGHSAQKKSTKLTLFEDLLHSSDTRNSHYGLSADDEIQGDSCPSDCESGISGAENEQQFGLSGNGLIRVDDGEMVYEIIKKKLVSSLNCYGFDAQVEAIHRNDHSGIMSRAKLQSFCIYSRAMEIKCGGNANVKYAWFGASKDEISTVLHHGFGLPMTTRTHGHAVHLSPVDHPVQSMELASPDEDGLRHMLLCRVILGKTEVVCPGSGQYHPSCEEFDSGVDNLVSPQTYIVWSSSMNTHILPEFVVSFRASSSCRGSQKGRQPTRQPNSEWMPFATLITTLSKFLPPDAIELISKNYRDYKKQRMTRHEMIQVVRQVAGDKLLMTIIKSYRGKINASRSSGSGRRD